MTNPRFWIAQEVANTKEGHDARHLFQMARERAGKKPQILVTDGLKSYNEACSYEYWTPKIEARTVHIRHITLTGERHNNKMEGMNGEIRDREKVTRNIKTKNSPILAGLQIYHNYVRPHQGLKGKTRAELAGIDIKGDNKWLTIIHNASQISKEKNTSMA
jgi:transposase-like protein